MRKPQFSIVYESSDFQIVHQPGPRDDLWLTFAGLGDRRPTAAGFIGREGASALHFISRNDDWFQSVDPGKLNPLVSRYRRGRVVVFGGSMGGYAALAFSAAFKADHVIASAPQVVIDQDVMQDTRWFGYLRPLKDGGRLRWPDAREGLRSVANIYALYDPRDRADRWHAERLRGRRGVTLLPFPGAGHAVFIQLNDIGYWPPVMQALLADDMEALAGMRRLIWRGRRKTYLYLCELGQALQVRGRFPAAALAYQRAIGLDPDAHKAWVWLRTLRLQMGDLQGALEAARGAAAAAGSNEELWTLYIDWADSARALALPQEADEAFRTARSAFPGHAALAEHHRLFRLAHPGLFDPAQEVV